MFSSERQRLLRSIRECLNETQSAIRRNEEAMRQGCELIDIEPLRIQQAELWELEQMLSERQESLN